MLTTHVNEYSSSLLVEEILHSMVHYAAFYLISKLGRWMSFWPSHCPAKKKKKIGEVSASFRRGANYPLLKYTK